MFTSERKGCLWPGNKTLISDCTSSILPLFIKTIGLRSQDSFLAHVFCLAFNVFSVRACVCLYFFPPKFCHQPVYVRLWFGQLHILHSSYVTTQGRGIVRGLENKHGRTGSLKSRMCEEVCLGPNLYSSFKQHRQGSSSFCVHAMQWFM